MNLELHGKNPDLINRVLSIIWTATFFIFQASNIYSWYPFVYPDISSIVCAAARRQNGVYMKNRCFSAVIIISLLILTGCSFKRPLTSDTEITAAVSNIPLSPEVTAQPSGIDLSSVTPSPVITHSPELTQPTIIPSPTVIPDYSSIAENILSHMNLEEKVGQMFFVRCRGDQALEDIKAYHLGGYILFAEDFKDKTKDDIISTIKGYQDASLLPMLIGVDEEGGSVNRVSKYEAFRAAPFQSPQELYQSGGFDLIAEDTVEKARLLKSLGINVNLAPVCDVSTDPDDFIYSRSFEKNAEETSAYVKTVVSAMNKENIGCTLKHFPGYGNNQDTHTGIAVDNRSYQSFLVSDFLPFEAGIEAGAGSILVSHNIVTSIDKDHPASLSPKIHDILRNELGFGGVIMTDDLSMDAIKEFAGDKEAAVLAVSAGNDLLIASDFDIQIPAVIKAVKDGALSENQIDEAVRRVLIWKLSLIPQFPDHH